MRSGLQRGNGMTHSFRRLGYAQVSTPIERMERLGRALGGANLYVKRDDCTGVGLGGNKCRKLDYLVADAVQRGAETLLTVGGIQSNHVRQTAAFAARAGLSCEAVLEPVLADPPESYRSSGNVLLTELLGTRVRLAADGDDLDAALEARSAALRQQGRKPYVIPMGGSNAIGALGYVDCAKEILKQAAADGLRFDRVVLGTGSCGTQAGLVAGFLAEGAAIQVTGYSVSPTKAKKLANLEGLVRATLELLGCEAPRDLTDRLQIDDGFFGSGYGQADPRATEAIRLAAREEGILLDPVYTGKAMAGLLHAVREHLFEPDENILFLHTGGSPALFAYPDLFGDLVRP